MTNRTLTDAEIEALGPEYRRLIVLAETQTIEQREFLRKEITADHRISPALRNRLLQDVDAFKLELATVDTNNMEGKPQVKVVYTIEDDLYAYLRRPELPERLRGFLDGGIELETKDTAVDPMPKTGKTKPR